ncbi:hypothetical protein CHLRE_03g194350v5 [Chlamydomonas reinhardtii]|uniref:Proton pump-interactor 1 n=1 Tax=Chlamydomonas reinhardtii TaxID=3055 RepID=A0A2K3DYI3_CHLRE|nr:uncharacterized protein CHLRE_03g194350v5 [Chlamydomonas reinhardtii]PNW85600.1 hypothetical protein CHLRE_03g194350v5 [Chlamydomonas reinhardtii]
MSTEALEQRERKPHKVDAAEANGHSSDVPDFAAAEEFAADVAGDSTDVPEPEDAEAEASTSHAKIYFVRVPRPPYNDDLVKKLSAQFQEQVAKLKGMNAKMAAKREELREVRRQLVVGRSLKDGSQPEYEEKLNRLKQLRDLRNGYVAKIQAIKENLRGLDCKSEEELDAKVKELEDKISHGSLILREEKQVVQQISKLQTQRAQIRDYDNQKNALTELEAETQKVKVVMAELDGEFGILKAERDQAQGIIKEIMTKVKAFEAELKDMEEEQKEAVAAKNEALAALDKARTDMNESMVDYRDNRTFSLKVRDMVTAGQVEEARALCVAQVDEYVGKIASDFTFRKEYYSLWASQRRYAVSELLPDSTTVVKEPRAGDAGKPGAKGGKPDKGAKAPPPKPQGAEKAKLLIEQLMAEASAEVSRKNAGRPPVDADYDEGDADDELDETPAAPAPVAEAAKPRAAAASARPADVLKSVELPKIVDEEFVPPVMKTEADKAAAAAEKDKERQREEQMRRMAEAEEKKRKAAEAKEKKRKEMEAKRKADEEAKKIQDAAEAAERAKHAAAERAAAEAKKKAAEAAAKAAAEAKAANNPAAKVIAKSQVTVAAKAKPPSNDLMRYWKMFKKNTSVQMGILAAVLSIIMIALVVMAARS